MFSPPTFNLTANLWRWASWGGAIPPIAAPDVAAVPCQLRVLKTGVVVNQATIPSPCAVLSFPSLTDVRTNIGFGQFTEPGEDLAEVPSASGRYYTVKMVEDVAKGFANEYRLAVVAQFGAPMPLP